MKKTWIILALTLLMPLAARAEVTATNIALSTLPSGNPDQKFNVPVGKVLLSEHINRITTNSWIVVVSPGLPVWFDSVIVLPGGTRVTSFNPSLKVTAGSEIQLRGGSGFTTAIMYALLVDQSDLYAAISSEFSGMSLAAGGADVHIELDTARPAIVKLEESVDLLSWSTMMGSPVAKASQSKRYLATIPTDKGKDFIRAKARSR